MDLKAKRVMQRIVLILILGLSLNNLFAQELKLGSEVYPEHRYYPLRGEIFYKAYTQIKGSAYLNDDWIIGDIYLVNGKILHDVEFKADIYAHELLVYNDYLKRVVRIERGDIEGFKLTLNGKERYFKRTRSGRNLKLGHDEFFVEVLHEGYLALYKLHFKEIIPLKIPEMPYIDEFYDNNDYYLVYKGDWDQIKLRKRVLIKKFPEYKDEIKKYCRKNKLKLRREEDFAKLIDHIGSVIEIVEKVN